MVVDVKATADVKATVVAKARAIASTSVNWVAAVTTDAPAAVVQAPVSTPEDGKPTIRMERLNTVGTRHVWFRL